MYHDHYHNYMSEFLADVSYSTSCSFRAMTKTSVKDEAQSTYKKLCARCSFPPSS